MKNEATLHTKTFPTLSSLSSCRESRSVRLSLRIAVKLVMLVSAAVVGYESFLLLSNVQRAAQRQQYLAVARKIQSSTLFSMSNRLEALTMGVSTFLQFCPNATQWPTCAIPFDLFLEGFDPLTRMTESRALTTVITVMPPEVPLFENFSYSFFEQSGFPDLGISPFGRGIYAINTSTGERFHDTTGDSCPLLQRRLLLPILQVTNPEADASAIMYNAYSDFPGGRTYDQAFDCVERNGLSSPNAFSAVRDALDCVSFSGFIRLVQDVDENQRGRPSTLTIIPVVPRALSNVSSNASALSFSDMNADMNTITNASSSPTTSSVSSSSLLSTTPPVRGFFGVAFNWDSLLAQAGTERVTGIEVVIRGPYSMAYTYLYKQGVPHLQGAGDLHSSRFEDQAFIFTVNGNYTLFLYPTRAWISLYENEMPIILCVVFVGLGVFTCIVFSLYDILLNREVLHQEAVMRTKRQYLRYISHEIRTPLNVVHLGFSVLLLEITQFTDALREGNEKGDKDREKEKKSESTSEEKKEGEESIERLLFSDSVREEEKEVEEGEEQEEEGEEEEEEEEHEEHEEQESGLQEVKEAETAETEPGKGRQKERRRSSKLLWSERLQRREEDIQRRAALSVPLSLAERTSLSQHLREWLELVSDMVESAQASVDVLNALLDYDKIEAQAMPLRREPLKVWSMVSSAVRPFLVQAKAKHISLTVDVIEFEESDSGKERVKQEEERDLMGKEEKKNEKKADQRDRESGSEKSVGLDWDEMEREREREIDREREIAFLSLSPPSLQWLREQEVVFGDRAKLHQVLRNLVSNALKFTPMEGHVSVRMHCRPLTSSEKTLRREMERARAKRMRKRSARILRSDSNNSVVSEKEIVAPNEALLVLAAEEERHWLWEGTAVISVRDTGVGMSAENVKRVFEEGVQFNPNQLQAGQGSGLGLWISQGIVRLHQGRLYACSEGEGKGSEFVLELPLFRPRELLCLLEEGGKSAEAKEEAPKVLPSLSHHELWRTQFRRVLVVDDSSTSRRMLCRSLAIEGCECTQACDGLECVEMVLHTRRGQFDLILLDYEMPNLTGPEAAAILRAEGVGLPIVGVTGHVLEEDIKFFIRHGADRVLHKPFTPVELENVLMELVSSFQER